MLHRNQQNKSPAHPARALRFILTVALLLSIAASAQAQANGAPQFNGVQKSAENSAGEAIMFYIFAGVTLLAGLGICLSQNIVRMAVYLFATLGSVAALYFLLLANFVGAIQLIVYAGGTLILLIFGVMLTSKSPWVRFDVRRREMISAGTVCVLFLTALLIVVTGANWPVTSAPVTGTTVAGFGQTLLTHYLVPFEVLSVLLLVVMIGAAYLARQE